jgi:hypothetical protein
LRTAARREDLAIAKVEANGRSAGDQRKELLRVLAAEPEHAERVQLAQLVLDELVEAIK